MIPKSIQFKSDEYHTTFLSSNEINNDASIFNSATSFIAKGRTFQLPDCEGIQNWQRLFEEFRLNKIVVTFTPVQTENRNRAVTVGAPAGDVLGQTQTPFAYYLIDRNDIDVSTLDENAFKAYKGVVRKLATEPHVISFSPSVLNAVYAGPAIPPDTTPQLNYNIVYKKNWVQLNLGAASVNQPYWGIKYGLGPSTPAGAYNMRVSMKYYISFRKKIR